MSAAGYGIAPGPPDWDRMLGPAIAGNCREAYIGIGHPNWYNDSPHECFISATTLMRYRSRGDDWPIRGDKPWAGDCGAFTAQFTKHPELSPWHLDGDDYGSLWTRLMEDMRIPPDFVAVQDTPCEPQVLAALGRTARDNAEESVASYLYLSEQFPFIPWLPTLQGWEPDDYLYCDELYRSAGVDLASFRRVGLGSICRRGSETEIATLVEMFAGKGYRMHSFGASINGLRRIGHLVYSTDTQAWSLTARNERLMLPGCHHLSKPDKVTGERRLTDCRNCFRYACHYRGELVDAIRFSAAQAAARQARVEAVLAAPAGPIRPLRRPVPVAAGQPGLF